VPNTGWFADPTGRHRLRYRDRQWTVSVADGDKVEQDPTGLREIDVARRRNRIIVGIALAICIPVLVLVVASISSYNQESNYQQDVHERLARAFIRELDSWQLPASVTRSTEPDRIEVNGPQNLVWVTRSFVPQPGFTANQAANDLVAGLRAQGYRNSAVGDSRTFDCKDNHCSIFITVNDDRIDVLLMH
jgi:hypothetical protein